MMTKLACGMQRQIQRGGGEVGGAHPVRAPPKIEKKNDFLA